MNQNHAKECTLVTTQEQITEQEMYGITCQLVAATKETISMLWKQNAILIHEIIDKDLITEIIGKRAAITSIEYLTQAEARSRHT